MRDRNGNETVVGGSAGSLATLGFGDDSSYQNLCEFIGLILGILTLRLLGHHDTEFELRTDSVSALRWAEKEKYRGDLVTNASILFTFLVIAKNLTVTAASHIEAALNHKCDDLSRIGERGARLTQQVIAKGVSSGEARAGGDTSEVSHTWSESSGGETVKDTDKHRYHDRREQESEDQ